MAVPVTATDAGAAKEPPPVPNNSETVALSAVTMSTMPSAFMSAAASAVGAVPVVNARGRAEGSPTCPRSTDTVLPAECATATSGRPSALRSATITARASEGADS